MESFNESLRESLGNDLNWLQRAKSLRRDEGTSHGAEPATPELPTTPTEQLLHIGGLGLILRPCLGAAHRSNRRRRLRKKKSIAANLTGLNIILLVLSDL